MIFKTIYKSNENYTTLKDAKENNSINLKQTNLLNINKFAHFTNVEDQNLNMSKTGQSKRKINKRNNENFSNWLYFR